MAADGPTVKSPEDEIRELKEKNSVLVQKVQYWKMTAAQRDDEKIDLMKELNELRLTMSHYRNSGAALDSALDAAVQEFGQHSLTRLVEVSSSITRTVEVMKTYIRKKREVESMSPCGKQSMRDSSLRDTTRGSNKVLRVVPMIRGSAIIKPTIRLRPIDATAHALRQAANMNSDDNSSTTSEEEHTPPRHMLQEVYIPLRRIDAELALDTVNVARRARDADTDADADGSLDASGMPLDEDEESGQEGDDEDQHAADGEGGEESEREEVYNAMRGMDPLPEETEEENWSPHVRLTRQLPNGGSPEDPLEGPSWLLERRHNDAAAASPAPDETGDGAHLEADSTTDARGGGPGGGEGGDTPHAPAPATLTGPYPTPPPRHVASSPVAEYTPTQRARRKRPLALSPRVSLALLESDWPRPTPPTATRSSAHLRDQDPTKVLVLVSKMRLGELRRGAGAGEAAGAGARGGDDDTPRRAPRDSLDAPSPNGSTQDAGPIVMDSPEVYVQESTASRGARRDSPTVHGTRDRSSEFRAKRDARGSRRDNSAVHSNDGTATHRARRESFSAHETIRESTAHAVVGEPLAHSSVRESIVDNVTVRGSRSSANRTVRRSISAQGTDRESGLAHGIAQGRTTSHGTVRESTAHGTVREGASAHGTARESASAHGTLRDGATAHETVQESMTARGTVTESRAARGTVRESATARGTVRESATARGTVRESATAHEAVREGSTSHGTVGESLTAQGTVREGSVETGERPRGSSESEGEAEEGRTKRRRRGQISYKEKPLNRKLRR